jgi:hypothetical protein
MKAEIQEQEIQFKKQEEQERKEDARLKTAADNRKRQAEEKED